MSLFSIYADQQVILMSGGVYYQRQIYLRSGYLYAQHGGGYIRLNASGSTSKPGIVMVGLCMDKCPCVTNIGWLCVGDADSVLLNAKRFKELTRGVD